MDIAMPDPESNRKVLKNVLGYGGGGTLLLTVYLIFSQFQDVLTDHTKHTDRLVEQNREHTEGLIRQSLDANRRLVENHLKHTDETVRGLHGSLVQHGEELNHIRKNHDDLERDAAKERADLSLAFARQQRAFDEFRHYGKRYSEDDGVRDRTESRAADAELKAEIAVLRSQLNDVIRRMGQ